MSVKMKYYQLSCEKRETYFIREKKLLEALENYNKSILLAPHPKLACDEIDKNEFTSLAMGYGNRSAVLFQLKEYKICMNDIDRSIYLCTSKITQFKLKERKLKCLLALEWYKEAQELMKSCKILLNSLQLEDKVKDCYRNTLSKISQQCTQGKKRLANQNENRKSKYEEIKYADASTSFSSDDLIFAYNNPRPPSLDDEPNPTTPAFSRALKLQYSPDQGRYVVATRDIKPGEVIAVETAYTSCIKPEEPNSPLSFCTFCLSRCAAPLPCPECTYVVFCTEECRDKGWDKFHSKECPVYSQLLEIGIEWIQPYRIIAGQSLNGLKTYVSQFKKDKQLSPLEQILNKDQICDSGSYRGIYFLEGNLKTVITTRLFDYSIIAFMLTEMLIQSNRFFISNTRGKNVPDEEDIIFIGSLFIRHIFACSTNSYTITETHVRADKHNFPKNETVLSHSCEVGVGSGTYIAESFFNNSCIPSANIFFCGNVGVCQAARFIPSGCQVYACYVVPYNLEPDRTIRRKDLCHAYSFTCNCEACIHDWRISSTSDFIYPRLKTKDKRVSRNIFESTASLKLELNRLVKRNKSMDKILYSPIFDMDNYLDLALESIEFFDRFVVLPDHLYLHLNQIFVTICDLKYSCYFINQWPEFCPLLL